MKKLTLVFAAFLMFVSLGQAQYVFDKGDIGINAGLGVGYFNYGYIPSIEASVEIGVIPTGDIGLVSFGGMVGYKYSTYSWDYSYIDDYNFHQLAFGGRAAWHLHTFKSDKWDVYAGLGLGLFISSDFTTVWDPKTGKYKSVRDNRTGGYGEGFVGGRMMLNSGFGLFAEVGYNQLSTARFGLTFLM